MHLKTVPVQVLQQAVLVDSLEALGLMVALVQPLRLVLALESTPTTRLQHPMLLRPHRHGHRVRRRNQGSAAVALGPRNADAVCIAARALWATMAQMPPTQTARLPLAAPRPSRRDADMPQNKQG